MKFTDICFLTPDVSRLRAFYEAIFHAPSEGDEFHATLSAGGLWFTFDSAIHLATTDAFSYAKEFRSGGVIVSFDVDDADAEFARLKSLGVADPQRPHHSPLGRALVPVRGPRRKRAQLPLVPGRIPRLGPREGCRPQ